MNRLVAAVCLSACLAVAAHASSARAQEAAVGDQVVVTLWSGATFRGTLVGRDDRHLTLRSAGGTVRELPLSGVLKVLPAEVATAPAASPAAGDGVAVIVAPAQAPAPAAATGTAPAMAPQPQRAAALPPPVADEGLRVGVAVSLPGSSDLPTFYVPIRLDADLRLEPEVGFSTARVGGETATLVQLGLGLLFTKAVAPQVGAYGGARVQVQRFSATGFETETAFRVAAVAGGEWQPVSRVGVGAEAQLGFVSVDGGSQLGRATGLSTAGLLFVRVYLN